MDYDEPIYDLIQRRTSCFKYDGYKRDEVALDQLNDFILGMNVIASPDIRFVLLRHFYGKKSPLGTYGIITEANDFIIGLIQKEGGDPVKFGRLFEEIILFATALKLDTCWLGATFKCANFAAMVCPSDNEIIPIVSPVGIASKRRRQYNRFIRPSFGSNRRKAFNELFFDGSATTPLSKEAAGIFLQPLEAVRLGPSASNKQPWRVVKDDGAFHFYLCRTKVYGVANFDIQKNDMGIALCHFSLTAADAGLNGRFDYLSTPPEVADWEYIMTFVPECPGS